MRRTPAQEDEFIAAVIEAVVENREPLACRCMHWSGFRPPLPAFAMDSSGRTTVTNRVFRTSFLAAHARTEDRDQLIQLLHSAFERNLLDADALDHRGRAVRLRNPRCVTSWCRARRWTPSMSTMRTPTLSARSSPPPTRAFRCMTAIATTSSASCSPGPGCACRPKADFSLRDWLRPAVFIPNQSGSRAAARVRVSRNHMAVVVDEYGGVAGQ